MNNEGGVADRTGRAGARGGEITVVGGNSFRATTAAGVVVVVVVVVKVGDRGTGDRMGGRTRDRMGDRKGYRMGVGVEVVEGLHLAVMGMVEVEVGVGVVGRTVRFALCVRPTATIMTAAAAAVVAKVVEMRTMRKGDKGGRGEDRRRGRRIVRFVQ
jgi:hypothetical protein